MGGWWNWLLQFCARIPAIEWALWAAAVVLTVSLLMWTRWGKTQLTHKCLALSLYTHLLIFLICIWFLSKEMIVGAPGPLGREGAPGKVGNHPTLLVKNVQVGGDPDANELAGGGVARPWHVTPLRATPPPTPAGPDRTLVDLAAPPQRPVREPASFDTRLIEAEPLSPRTPQTPVRSDAAPADHLAPAETPAAVGATRPMTQEPLRISPSQPGDLPRERVPSNAPQLSRGTRTTSDSLLQPPSNATESRPLSGVDRASAGRGQTPTIPDAGAPADSGDPTEEPETTRLAPSGNSERGTTDRPDRLLTEANRRQSEPMGDPPQTSSVDSHRLRPHDLPPTYGHRRPDRQNIVTKQGGSPDTEAAVKSALAWLAANQEPGGQWDAAKHGAERDRTETGDDVKGRMRPDAGITGLALLAFLGAGHTHQGEQYQDNVRRGLDYLIRIQAKDGSLSGGATLLAAMYCHGMATLALAEAYGMTGDAKLLPPLRRAVGYTLKAQIRHDGGWRYRSNDPGGMGDTSQFGWQLMALKAAETAGLDIPVATSHGMLRFLKYVTWPEGRGGLAGYCYTRYADGSWQPDRPTPTMTAEALFCRFLLGTTTENPLCQEAADYLLKHLPDERTDYYYWYYGALALYQLQGPAWETWNQAVQKRILNLQKRDGSWDPNDRWGGHGGRVFSTALATLTLEVYYRYKPAR